MASPGPLVRKSYWVYAEFQNFSNIFFLRCFGSGHTLIYYLMKMYEKKFNIHNFHQVFLVFRDTIEIQVSIKKTNQGQRKGGRSGIYV